MTTSRILVFTFGACVIFLSITSLETVARMLTSAG